MRRRRTFKRIGIIGLDTSHSTAFTKEFDARPPAPKAAATGRPARPGSAVGFRVTAAYPKGSEDIESSASQFPAIQGGRQTRVKIFDSIDDLLKDVDYVCLGNNRRSAAS